MKVSIGKWIGAGWFPRAAVLCAVLGCAMGCALSTVFPEEGRSPQPQQLLQNQLAAFDELCRIDPGVRMRRWDYIILHHSASRKDSAASINEAHLKNGWKNGLGYDFVIGNGSLSGDGEIEVSNRWRMQIPGAHCPADDMNDRAIGICFVGNFEEDAGPSEEQMHSGLVLVRYLARKFSIPPGHILGHGDVDGAQTLCPGRHFPLLTFKAAGVR